MAASQKNHQNAWNPSSWRDYPVKQQPIYSDENKFNETLKEIGALPPFVFAEEIDALKASIKKCQEGKMFFLQAGDCAERFADCYRGHIINRVQNIEKMASILHEGFKKPILQIGRMAGQYAKPRSSPFETVDGVKIPSYKGDIINSFDLKNRNPDPARLHRGYTCSATTMNTIRGYLKNFPVCDKEGHSDTTDTSSLSDCPPIDEENFFVSHEALLLAYEETFTTYNNQGDTRPYNLSGHFLWIGERTRTLNEAHVEYFRGIANPVGVKVGPTADPKEIIDLVSLLNPNNEPGKIVLISRMGIKSVREKLPPIVERVKAAGKTVLWVCDPMHSNTYATESKIKTRNYASILEEAQAVNEILTNAGCHLGGVHLEATWEDVTECLDSTTGITEEGLKNNYTTSCDPRLNGTQCENFTRALVNFLSSNQ